VFPLEQFAASSVIVPVAPAMATSAVRVSFALQRAEEEVLRAAGFTVKNTFIVEADSSDVSPSDAQPRVQRAVTAPARKQPMPEVAEWEEDDAMSDATADDQVAPVPDCSRPRPLFLRSDSDASTAATESSDSELPLERVRSPSGASEFSQPEEPKLAKLVRRECAFLRIVNCAMVPLAPRTKKRVPLGGVAQCLRVCVIGLPSLKRHKWQQPLAWAVAHALERVGCPAAVRRGELFAAMDAEDGGELVRIDLCAPRAGDHGFDS